MIEECHSLYYCGNNKSVSFSIFITTSVYIRIAVRLVIPNIYVFVLCSKDCCEV